MLLFPNAKINLGLNIVSRRNDGYHELRTVFFPATLSDRLQIEPLSDSGNIIFETSGDLRVDCPDDDNLIVRTCRMFQQEKHIGGVRIRFEKHIPFGAGLGGGSSDAAHTAIALNDLFSLRMSKTELKQMVVRLGADCPFFIDNTPSYAEGIGDKLSPVSGINLSGYKLVLLKPDIYVSTREAYAGITPCTPAEDIRTVLSEPVANWRGRLKNDFESTVFSAHPELGEIKCRLYESGAVYASMSGSGSTMFGIFPEKTDINENALAPGCFVFTQSLSSY